MRENEFWHLINKLDWDMAGDDDAVIRPVVELLSTMSTEEIYSFEDILSKKLYALDTMAHAREMGQDAYVNDEEYFSPDAFLYSRCVVVANGEELFNQVLNNPKDYPKDLEFEAILGVASAAYELKTGNEWAHVVDTSYETFSNKEGWQ